MKLRLLWFGRSNRSPWETQVQDYIKRIHRRWPAEDIPLRPDRRGRDADPTAALRREAEILFEKRPRDFKLVALDEGGVEYSSVELAARLARWEEGPAQGILFVIGSDRGLAPEVLEAAQLRLSLSRLTFPHQMARVMLWEQLYRAVDILGSGRYHRS